jgi:O-antigen/teichoic acid export membrane protein
MAPLQRSIPIQQIPSGPVLGDPEAPIAEADPPQEGRMLRRVAAYAVSRGASEGMLAVRGVLLATLLGPAAFGSWALLRLSTRYASLAGLSIFRGFEVELLQSKSSRASSTALGSILFLTGGLALVALVASFLGADAHQRLLFRSFAAAAVAEGLYNYALVWTRVRTTLRRYAILEAVTAALHLAIGVALARVWGLAGALAALALANAAGFAVAAFWIHIRPGLDVPVMRRMLRVGIPLALTGCIGTALQTADRWVVAVWGGPTLLGYYAFAGAVAGAATALSLVIRIVVFPKVYADARSAAPGAAIRLHLTNTLLPFARLFPPVLGAAGLLLGPVLARVLPAYLAAVAPARIFLLSGAATGIVNLASIGAVAAGRQRQLPAYAATALTVNLVLSFLFLALGLGLEAVAAASFTGHLLFATAVLRLIASEGGIPDPGRFALSALVPLAWCAVAVLAAAHLSARTGAAAVGAGMYLLLLLPLLPLLRREWRRLGREPARG